MSGDEQRQHFRVDDKIHFDFCEVSASDALNESAINERLLGKQALKYRELMHYYGDMDSQLAELDAVIHQDNPAIAHYFKLLNSKIEHLARFLLLETDDDDEKLVSLSIGGMAFDSNEQLNEKARLKVRINTKPKYIPVILDAKVVYCRFQPEGNFRVAIEFLAVNDKQEKLLSQHIMQGQTAHKPD